MGKIGISGCSTSMFQIEIDENNQDFLRFIWFDNVLSENPLLVFPRVVFGLTCSPFLLNGTLKVHLEKFVPIKS